jgi:endonuclease/exonuclease/phosphatase family metal-dependent hydrolase
LPRRESCSEPEPDLIALQELRRKRLPEWEAHFTRAATRTGRRWHVRHTCDLVGIRTNFLLVASSWPIVAVERPHRFEVPFFERVLSATVDVDGRPLELLNTHVPDGEGNGWRKVEHFEGLYRHIARNSEPARPPRILCGDFNTPRLVRDDGYVLTSAQREPSGKLIVDRGQRRDAAERSVIVGLSAFDLADVYRDHPAAGASSDDWSWVASNGCGRRFDHVFASAALRPVACGYLHSWREEGLSDHSPIWAGFDWPG